MDRIITRTALTRTLFFLVHPNRSISNAMIFSNTAIIVDSAAKVRNRKNSALHKNPPGICAKILGSVINTRLGPAPGSIP